MWPSRSYDRIMQSKARREHKERQDFLALADLILEVVHPGNLGPLQPSPETNRYKARLMGL